MAYVSSKTLLFVLDPNVVFHCCHLSSSSPDVEGQYTLQELMTKCSICPKMPLSNTPGTATQTNSLHLFSLYSKLHLGAVLSGRSVRLHSTIYLKLITKKDARHITAACSSPLRGYTYLQVEAERCAWIENWKATSWKSWTPCIYISFSTETFRLL